MQNASMSTAFRSDGRGRPYFMVFHRFGFFLVWQAVIAAIIYAGGAPSPWEASIAWWPATATLTNITSILLLRYLTGKEGLTYRQLIGADFGREHVRSDLWWLLGCLVLAGPLAMGPNLGLAKWLFGDSMVAINLFIRPLPMWAILITMFSFPLTIAFAELPTYFAYVMPRLSARWGGSWWAMVVPALWLGAQHVTLPLIFDVRFILWRLLMFIPFALFLGLVLRLRPRLLPYLMGVHVLMDFATALQVLMASAGQ